MTTTSQRPAYHYTECGLENIYLVNGFHTYQEDDGEYIAFEDVEGLHRAIARALVQKNDPLSGKEFRFIRKHLDMSQKAMAQLLGFEEQAVLRWEKDNKVQKALDLVIRTLFIEKDEGNSLISSLIERMNENERNAHEEKITLKRRENVWVSNPQKAA